MNFKQYFQSQLLLETPLITLQGNTAIANDKPLKELPLVDVIENIVIIRQPNENGFIPLGWTLVYFMDSPESANEMKEGKMEYLMIPRATFMTGGSPITDVWKKKFQRKGHEHILGLLEGNSTEDEIFIDMMSVRAKYQRNSINTKMINALKETFPTAKVVFSNPTDKGKKFISSFIKEENELKYPEAKGDDIQTFGGEIGWKGKIIYMSPRRFLSLALYLPASQVNKKSIEHLKERIKLQLPLDPLVLMVDMKTRKVIGHEGRHRAKVCVEVGVKEVPVLIFTGSLYTRTPKWTPEQHREVEDVINFEPETP